LCQITGAKEEASESRKESKFTAESIEKTMEVQRCQVKEDLT